MSETYELVVIGAGPAGMEAAITAAEAGVNTLLIDNSPQAGGQYYKRLPVAFHSTQLTEIEKEGETLIAHLEATSVNQIYDAQVWGIFREENKEGWVITLNVSGTPQQIHAHTMVLAGGAYDTPIPFSGWTLPGVMTCGAVLSLIKNQRIAPFKRVLLSGCGPLLLSTAAHLIEAGVEVVQVCESNPFPIKAIPYAPTILREWQRMKEGIQYLADLSASHTPYKMGWSVVAAHGKDQVEEAVIARLDSTGKPLAGTQQTFQVDAVICGYWLSANTGMARSIGCKFEYHTDKNAWLPWRDQNLCSSLAGVYLVGDGAGIGGAENARLEGKVAGIRAAQELGHVSREKAGNFYQQIQSDLSQQRRFGQFLTRFFSPQPGLLALAQDDTIICRCEEITLGEVKAAVADGARTLGEVKMITRAGMGNCQGRMCGYSIANIIVHELVGEQVTPESVGMYSIHPPFQPLPVGFLVRAADET